MKIFSLPRVALVVMLLVAVAIVRSQTQRFPQFENEDVKVWKSVVMPNAPLTMHRHDHPRVIIALSGGTMKIVDQHGKSEAHVGNREGLLASGKSTRHHARRRQCGR
jgi:hypothetical protein